MASQINITNIDANFPVAGQDNSSQGFRDNFAAIKIAFTTATSEISDLQLNTVKLNSVNDFTFSGSLRQTTLQASGFTALSPSINTTNVDFALGHYHNISISQTSTFTVSNWPGNNIFSQVRVAVTPTTTTNITINFGAGTGDLYKESNVLPYNSTSTGVTVWDLWTVDGGESVFVKFVGGPYTV